MSATVRPSFFRRISSGMPLLITVVVHVVLIAIAGAVVVQQNIVGKKKTFEASATDTAPKAVEHRLQIARRGGASGGVSNPVSANRIFTSGVGAVAMPEMPELPSLGAGGFGGFGGMGSGVGLGAGVGMSTSLGGGAGLGGRGFMSLSFLGMTEVRANKVVFVVDIGPGLLDIRKGGIRAFEIMHREITRLVAALPPSAEFNVVFFARDQIRLFASTLQPASSENKKLFFSWIAPINADLQSLGTRSIPASSPRWTRKADDSLKLDETYRPPLWLNAVHAALEQQPDTVFLVTGGAHSGSREADPAAVARSRRQREKYAQELVRQGYDLAAIAAARSRALAKLRADFNEINRKLVASGRDPFVIQDDIRRVLASDFQAALKRAGFTLQIDRTGWTDKSGNLMWDSPASVGGGASGPTYVEVDFSEALAHVARLQAGLGRRRASLNVFLFTGPNEKNERAEKNLGALASRNGGRFSVLTTKRLEDLGAATASSS
jgi:hypothetical protein